MKRLLLISIMLMSTSLSAEVLQGFCFNALVSLDNVKRHLTPILLSKDVIFKRKSMNCLEIRLSRGRKNLFEKYILKKFRIERGYSGVDKGETSSSIVKNCELEIVEKGAVQESGTLGKVGKKSQFKGISDESTSTIRSKILLGAGKIGRLRVHDSDIQLRCYPKNGDKFSIEVTVSTSKGGITTTVDTISGGIVDIGTIVKEQINKNRTVDTDAGLKYNKSKIRDSRRYTLMVR